MKTISDMTIGIISSLTASAIIYVTGKIYSWQKMPWMLNQPRPPSPSLENIALLESLIDLIARVYWWLYSGELFYMKSFLNSLWKFKSALEIELRINVVYHATTEYQQTQAVLTLSEMLKKKVAVEHLMSIQQKHHSPTIKKLASELINKKES